MRRSISQFTGDDDSMRRPLNKKKWMEQMELATIGTISFSSTNSNVATIAPIDQNGVAATATDAYD